MTHAPIEVVRYPADPCPARWRQPVLAIGNFDGVHRGHAKILERVVRQAAEHAATPVVLTFDPHPTRVVRPGRAPSLLMTGEQRIEALARAGIEGVAVVAFTSDMARWTPETFVERVLVGWLQVAEVWVGANFLFGRDRSGDFSRLRQLGEHHRFRVDRIDPVRCWDTVVSSSRVRRLVAEGRVDEAAALLGHHYFIDGIVVVGQRRGRRLGFPTANLESANELLPPRGVYATVSGLGETLRSGITNIGLRPTFGDATRTVVENHLFDFDRDIYGARLRLHFVRRVRDERAFDGPAALVEQIRADCRVARRLFERVSL